jgi:hypothetical protein
MIKIKMHNGSTDTIPGTIMFQPQQMSQMALYCLYVYLGYSSKMDGHLGTCRAIPYVNTITIYMDISDIMVLTLDNYHITAHISHVFPTSKLRSMLNLRNVYLSNFSLHPILQNWCVLYSK